MHIIYQILYTLSIYPILLVYLHLSLCMCLCCSVHKHAHTHTHTHVQTHTHTHQHEKGCYILTEAMFSVHATLRKFSQQSESVHNSPTPSEMYSPIIHKPCTSFVYVVVLTGAVFT